MMTQSCELIQHLRAAMPTIKAALKNADLARQFEDGLATLLASLEKLRVVLMGPYMNPVEVRRAMTMAGSALQEAEQLYLKMKGQTQPLFTKRIQSISTPFRAISRRPDANTAFEAFDQKANQLFNILATVLKSEDELRDGIARNIL